MAKIKIEKKATDSLNSLLVKYPQNTRSISGLVRDSKKGLIEGLASVESLDGWDDPTAEKAQSFWTSIEVMKSLLDSGVCPKNFNSILSIIQQKQIALNGLIGWGYEGIDNHISVYVTGDIIRLYLSLRKFDEIDEIIHTIQIIQNEDGGWGVCNGDKISKVRSTSCVLSILLMCVNIESTRKYVDLNTVKKGTNWLFMAQNDGDFGWGNLPDTLPSNVSATSLALNALLEAFKFSLSTSPGNSTIPVRKDSIIRGLEKLIDMNFKGSWQGVREEFAIYTENKIIGRHIIGGAGATIVLPVLLKAIETNLLSWPNDTIYNAIINLSERCKHYSKNGGLWLVPADDGGPSLSWNSAFALDAFNQIEAFISQWFIDKWIEKPVLDKLLRPLAVWRRISLVFGVALIGILLAPYLKSVGDIPSWFLQLNIFYQGLIMMVIALLFEQLYSKVWHAISKKI